jgi:hypothetical protein
MKLIFWHGSKIGVLEHRHSLKEIFSCGKISGDTSEINGLYYKINGLSHINLGITGFFTEKVWNLNLILS